MSSEISHCRFHENSVRKLLNENNSVTLRDEFTQCKAISQKSAFRFLSEDIYFVTIGFNALQNISLQIPQKQCYQTVQWKEGCNSVKWVHTSQRTFSESFFLVFIWGYLIFQIDFNAMSNTTFQIPQKQWY